MGIAAVASPAVTYRAKVGRGLAQRHARAHNHKTFIVECFCCGNKCVHYYLKISLGILSYIWKDCFGKVETHPKLQLRGYYLLSIKQGTVFCKG